MDVNGCVDGVNSVSTVTQRMKMHDISEVHVIKSRWTSVSSMLTPQVASGILGNDLTLTFRWWLETVLARI